MSDYPQKTCTIDRLVRHPKLIAAALAGKKTQQRRAGVYGYPGEQFTLKNMIFEITGLKHGKTSGSFGPGRGRLADSAVRSSGGDESA